MLGDFPAKNTVHTPCSHGPGQRPKYKQSYCEAVCAHCFVSRNLFTRPSYPHQLVPNRPAHAAWFTLLVLLFYCAHTAVWLCSCRLIYCAHAACASLRLTGMLMPLELLCSCCLFYVVPNRPAHAACFTVLILLLFYCAHTADLLCSCCLFYCAHTADLLCSCRLIYCAHAAWFTLLILLFYCAHAAWFTLRITVLLMPPGLLDPCCLIYFAPTRHAHATCFTVPMLPGLRCS